MSVCMYLFIYLFNLAISINQEFLLSQSSKHRRRGGLNVKSVIKTFIYFLVFLTCFAFVSWQCVQCIEKYIEKPQGTKLSLQQTSEIQQFPAITICANALIHRYDKQYLQKCGLRYDFFCSWLSYYCKITSNTFSINS